MLVCIIMPHYKDQGLLEKYELVRTDGRPEDGSAQTFVLRYDKNSAWCTAMRDIIKTTVVPRVAALGYNKLSEELLANVEQVEARLKATSTVTTSRINLPEL